MFSEIIAGFPNITKLRLKCVAVVPLLLLRRAHPRSRSCSRGRRRYCGKLTQASVGTIGRGCPDLEELNLTRVQFTDISEIARGCRKLKSLDVHSCHKLTVLPKELFDIPTLTKLDCSHCGADRPPKNVQEEGVDAMRRWWATPEGACVFQGKRPKGPMASWCVKCGKHVSEH